jgi:uncharacterized membrane protein
LLGYGLIKINRGSFVDNDNKPPAPFLIPVADLHAGDPLKWLQLGWQDFVRCPKVGLFYGLCFFAMGHALWWVVQEAPSYLLGLAGMFLLMGPLLCLGIYHASRECELGARPSLMASLWAWVPIKGPMLVFSLVMVFVAILWGRPSMGVLAVSFSTIPDTATFIRTLLNTDDLDLLLTFFMVGAIFAGLIFSITVVSIPMILDRQSGAVSAAITSFRACLNNPGVMLIWGATITALVVLAMLPWFLGLLVVAPVLGHATWHAYRSAVPSTPN